MTRHLAQCTLEGNARFDRIFDNSLLPRLYHGEESCGSRRLLRVFIKPDSRVSIAAKPKDCRALAGLPKECRISPRRGSRDTNCGRLRHSLAITSARSRTDVARPVQTLNTAGWVETPSMARISALTTSPT